MRVSNSIILCLALTIPALTQAQPTVTVIATFPPTMIGTKPSQLMQGAGGNFYGVTNTGGRHNDGTVFLMTPRGGLKILFKFNAVNGRFSGGPLVEGRDGYLYGTTTGGGTTDSGTIFKFDRTGTIQTLQSFISCTQTNCPNGASPNAGLIRGLDGSYYGTTSNLGNPGAVAFRIGPKGTYAVLHQFNHPSTGLGTPSGSLIQASDGNLYGVSSYTGGARGWGTIFMVTPQGQAKLLYSFGAPGMGRYPASPLIQAADGDLYGCTIFGGANGAGTLFKISLQGSYQKIYDLPVAGAFVFGGPIQASDGNLWVLRNDNRVLVITPAGSLVQIIDIGSMGIFATSGLMQGSDGRLYGGGSIIGADLIYAIDAGLPPPAPSIAGFTPTRGPAGFTVVVSGTQYVGATGVTFNGVSAEFVVNAAGVISATVPTGASTGPIQVTTPGGTVTSQTDFTVVP